MPSIEYYPPIEANQIAIEGGDRLTFSTIVDGETLRRVSDTIDGYVPGGGVWLEATGQTVGDAVADLATIALDDGAAYTVEAVFTGSDGAGFGVTYKRTANVYRTGGGNATHTSGSPNDDVDVDGGDTDTTATIYVTGSDANVSLRVDGKAGLTIDWRVAYRLIKHN